MTGYNDEWRLTWHAAERFAEMGLAAAEVMHVVNNPEVTYGAGGGGRYSSTSMTYQAGNLAVIVDPVDRTIVTILPRTTEDYTREKGRSRR